MASSTISNLPAALYKHYWDAAAGSCIEFACDFTSDLQNIHDSRPTEASLSDACIDSMQIAWDREITPLFERGGIPLRCAGCEGPMIDWATRSSIVTLSPNGAELLLVITPACSQCAQSQKQRAEAHGKSVEASLGDRGFATMTEIQRSELNVRLPCPGEVLVLESKLVCGPERTSFVETARTYFPSWLIVDRKSPTAVNGILGKGTNLLFRRIYSRDGVRLRCVGCGVIVDRNEPCRGSQGFIGESDGQGQLHHARFKEMRTIHCSDDSEPCLLPLLGRRQDQA